MTAPTQAHIEVPAPGTEHEMSAFGLGPPGWVALAMIVVIAIAVWKGVPRMIAAMLDRRIATIRAQLDQATSLRTEAEALLADARARQAAAHDDARAILAQAQHEAGALVDKARRDVDILIDRRHKMAEDKIAAAERTAIADVRAATAQAAAGAAAALLTARYDARADGALIDRTIASLG